MSEKYTSEPVELPSRMGKVTTKIENFGDLFEILENGHVVFWFNRDDWPALKKAIETVLEKK